MTRQEPVSECQPARLPLPLASVNRLQGALQQAALSKPYHARMTADLAGILGVAVEAIPPVLCGRVPLPLKVGIRDDLAARYPQADTEALGRWLSRWTGTEQYLAQVAASSSRYDLDGAPCGEIAEKDAAQARERLERAKKKPALLEAYQQKTHA